MSESTVRRGWAPPEISGKPLNHTGGRQDASRRVNDHAASGGRWRWRWRQLGLRWLAVAVGGGSGSGSGSGGGGTADQPAVMITAGFEAEFRHRWLAVGIAPRPVPKKWPLAVAPSL